MGSERCLTHRPGAPLVVALVVSLILHMALIGARDRNAPPTAIDLGLFGAETTRNTAMPPLQASLAPPAVPVEPVATAAKTSSSSPPAPHSSARTALALNSPWAVPATRPIQVPAPENLNEPQAPPLTRPMSDPAASHPLSETMQSVSTVSGTPFALAMRVGELRRTTTAPKLKTEHTLRIAVEIAATGVRVTLDKPSSEPALNHYALTLFQQASAQLPLPQPDTEPTRWVFPLAFLDEQTTQIDCSHGQQPRCTTGHD